MSIVSDDEILDFLDISQGYFDINAANDTMNLTSDQGGPSDITLTHDSYDGAALATEVQTQLNANTTLTGGTITFSVSYSSTTYKFTIDATAGHTIAYDHSESNAGYTLGFDTDATASQTITSDNAASDPTSIVTTLRNEVEDYVQNVHCRRTFEETSYSLERYDGNGSRILNLDNYPIIYLDRVSIWTLDAIKIRNTSDYTTASVSVSSTGLRLVKDGVADSTVTWASNDTMSAVVTAVNALGNGWEAAVMSSDYNSHQSSELLERWGASAIDDNWVYLDMPDEAEDGIKAYPDYGQIYRLHGFPSGHRNIVVDYTAGYSASNMPEDLKLAIKIMVKYIWQRRDEETFGIDSFTTGPVKALFDKGTIPKEAGLILGAYRRRRL